MKYGWVMKKYGWAVIFALLSWVLVLALVAGVGMLVTAVAHAQSARILSCEADVTSMNFGVVDTLKKSSHTDTTATLTVRCSGDRSRAAAICPEFKIGSGGVSDDGSYARQMQGSGTAKLNYQLYRDAARTQVLGQYSALPLNNVPALVIPFDTSGNATASLTIYGRVFGGQTFASPGSYSSMFAGNESAVRYIYDAGSGCTTSWGSDRISPQFTVSARVQGNCRISAEDIDFGATGVLNRNVDAKGRLSVTCTPGTDYRIALDNGNTGSGPTQRQMMHGGQSVTYGLYHDAARSRPWGSSDQNSVAGRGAGLTQNLTVYGRVPPQPTPSPGTYTDTVVVTVIY